MVGDLLQLPPVGERPVYASYKNNRKNFYLIWRHFKAFELTGVMRQRGDDTLIDLLNNVQIARPQPSDLTLLQSKTFSTSQQLEEIFIMKHSIYLLKMHLLMSTTRKCWKQ